MFTSPWHLILPSLLPGVCVALNSSLYLLFGLWLRVNFAIWHISRLPLRHAMGCWVRTYSDSEPHFYLLKQYYVIKVLSSVQYKTAFIYLWMTSVLHRSLKTWCFLTKFLYTTVPFSTNFNVCLSSDMEKTDQYAFQKLSLVQSWKSATMQITTQRNIARLPST
jgi:hypothetical protein